MSEPSRRSFLSRWLRRGVLAGLAVFVAIQFVPYGRNHSNPPVLKEPAWDSPATRATAVRACFDCHSNQSQWPWYSHVAPVSWLVQNHVDVGRSKLNFSEFNKPQKEAHEAAETVGEGEMPMTSYVLGHPDARLTAAEKDAFIQGLTATLGGEGKGGKGGKDDDD